VLPHGVADRLAKLVLQLRLGQQPSEIAGQKVAAAALAKCRIAGGVCEYCALRLANDTRFGLSAAVFTQDIDKAIRFAREVDSGNLHINFGTAWRAETMPYGGLKDSGMGKEGPKYAIEEMTETKMVVIH